MDGLTTNLHVSMQYGWTNFMALWHSDIVWLSAVYIAQFSGGHFEVLAFGIQYKSDTRLWINIDFEKDIFFSQI